MKIIESNIFNRAYDKNNILFSLLLLPCFTYWKNHFNVFRYLFWYLLPYLRIIYLLINHFYFVLRYMSIFTYLYLFFKFKIPHKLLLFPSIT